MPNPQGDLFGNDTSSQERDRLHNQLIKLGDMMGGGLHHEADGRWISREYKKISKALMPEFFADQRKKKRASVDTQISKLVAEKNCPCGGQLRQTRKGCKTLECQSCHKRYVATSKKKNGNNQ